MHALAGTHYFEIGGKKRPARFNTTNQTGKFCDIRKIGLPEYADYMSEKGLQNPTVIRDFLFSALFAGAISEKQPVDFDEYTVGDWIDQLPNLEKFMAELGQAITGSESPNAPTPALKIQETPAA